jgi:hypothetical protein
MSWLTRHSRPGPRENLCVVYVFIRRVNFMNVDEKLMCSVRFCCRVHSSTAIVRRALYYCLYRVGNFTN